jgi:hypothetical protein
MHRRIFSLVAGTATLVQTITDGIGNPQSVAVDASAKSYVANWLTTGYGGDVTVYDQSSRQPRLGPQG